MKCLLSCKFNMLIYNVPIAYADLILNSNTEALSKSGNIIQTT